MQMLRAAFLKRIASANISIILPGCGGIDRAIVG
jgi:hypothetical protein